MYHKAGSTEHLKKVRSVIKGGGYTTGKQNHSVKSGKLDPAEAIEHESSDDNVVIPGKKLGVKKLKDGGCAGSGETVKRLDKAARGGPMKPRKATSHVHVNVIVPQGGKQGIPVPAGAAPMGGSSVSPVAPPPHGVPGGAPLVGGGAQGLPGGPGGMPPGAMGGMKTGGRVMKETHGAGGGEGRLDKLKAYGEKPKKMK